MEYFVVERKSNNNFPLVRFDQNNGVFYKQQPLKIVEPIQMCLKDPKPKNLQMVDYHYCSPSSVISDKMRKILESLKIQGIQLLSAKISDIGEEESHYWYLHIYKRIECMDKRLSEFSQRRSGAISIIDQLVLDDDKLKAIPLKERLIFKLEERMSVDIFHKQICDLIKDASVGLRFIPADKWNDDSAFE